MPKDLYKILGITKTANDSEIKKAYKKLAMKWHPDKNQNNKKEAENKFKDIGEAYGILSDKNKRNIYDQVGYEGLKGQPPTNNDNNQPNYFNKKGKTFVFRNSSNFNTDPYDIFSQVFGDMSGMGSMSGMGMDGMGGVNRVLRPKKIERIIRYSFEQLKSGKTRNIKITKNIQDGHTNKVITATKVLTINTRPWWKTGTKITFEGEGDELHGQKAQDICFIIEEEKHSRFIREGNDLILTVDLPLKKSLCGGVVNIKSLDNKDIEIKLNKVINQDTKHKVKGYGMPCKGGGFGDIIVKYNIIFPKTLTQHQKNTLNNIL